MIGEWLHQLPRDPSGFSFEVTDIVESGSQPTGVELASLMREAYWGEGYLAGLADRYGWHSVAVRFTGPRSGARVQVRRGDFGEAVATRYLHEVEQYEIPVPKLRLKITANETLPGTDCIALKVTGAILREVCFVETKLRIPLDSSVAVKGYIQLRRDSKELATDMITFTARRLREMAHPLADAFERYLFSRDEQLETYKVLVFHEHSTWDEQVLANLEDEGPELEPLTVYVAAIADLLRLSDEAFRELDAQIVDDYE